MLQDGTSLPPNARNPACWTFQRRQLPTYVLNPSKSRSSFSGVLDRARQRLEGSCNLEDFTDYLHQSHRIGTLGTEQVGLRRIRLHHLIARASVSTPTNTSFYRFIIPAAEPVPDPLHQHIPLLHSQKAHHPIVHCLLLEVAAFLADTANFRCLEDSTDSSKHSK